MKEAKISLRLVITIVVLVSGMVGTYYTGLDQSKAYADEKVEKVETEIRQEQKEMKQAQQQAQTDIAVIKQILVQQYGDPKCDPDKEGCNG